MAADYDRRLLPTIVKEVLKLQQIDEIDGLLGINEACNSAIVGSMSKDGSKEHRSAVKWREGLIRRRDKLIGVSRPTIWDTLKGKSKRI